MSSFLLEKFAVNSVTENEDHDERKNVSNIRSCPIFDLETFSDVGFCLIIFPAPTVSGDTEEQVNQRTQRQKDVAYKEILQVQDRSAEDAETIPCPNVVSEYARQ